MKVDKRDPVVRMWQIKVNAHKSHWMESLLGKYYRHDLTTSIRFVDIKCVLCVCDRVLSKNFTIETASIGFLSAKFPSNIWLFNVDCILVKKVFRNVHRNRVESSFGFVHYANRFSWLGSIALVIWYTIGFRFLPIFVVIMFVLALCSFVQRTKMNELFGLFQRILWILFIVSFFQHDKLVLDVFGAQQSTEKWSTSGNSIDFNHR